MTQLFYGGVPVPYTVSWSAEETFRLEHCPFVNARAICQTVARGVGKPQFGKPHMQRQREAIARGLCDLCGRPLKIATKVSLSHARPMVHAHRLGDILQVEPLLHKHCAMTSMAHCPALKKDLDRGTVAIRQVTAYDVQFAIMDEVFSETITGIRVKAAGHAKVQLKRWADRDLKWLERARA